MTKEDNEERKCWGHKIEDRMMAFFKGSRNQYDEVDFETSTSLYEVKSCRLINKCSSGNFAQGKTKERSETTHFGRFCINTNNHILLYLRSLQLNKKPKYIFVLRVGNQTIFKIRDWAEVSILNNKDIHHIPLSKVFNDE